MFPAIRGDQLVFADQLPGALHQSGQNIKRTAAHTHRVIVFEQKSLCRNQAEGAERDRAFGRDEIGHLNMLHPTGSHASASDSSPERVSLHGGGRSRKVDDPRTEIRWPVYRRGGEIAGATGLKGGSVSYTGRS